MKTLLGAALAASLLVAAPARAGCWTVQDVEAAKVRDLQSMLMVGALRCRAIGRDILPDYNGFVNASRVGLVAINDRLKARFFGDLGPTVGQRHYDRFTTALANAYGAGGTDEGLCADMAALAREAQGEGGDVAGLIRIADRQGLAPALPGAMCNAPVVMAETSLTSR